MAEEAGEGPGEAGAGVESAKIDVRSLPHTLSMKRLTRGRVKRARG